MIRPCPFTDVHPSIDPSAYVDVSAQVIGQVRIGPRSSLWPNVVVRGDVNTIDIGADVNVQDLSCLHVLKDRFGLTLGDRVSLGHSVTLHGCKIGAGSLVGMGAIVLDGAEIGEECLIAAHALVTPGTKVPPRSLVVGSPAKVKRELTADELALLDRTWRGYVEYAKGYVAKFGRGF